MIRIKFIQSINKKNYFYLIDSSKHKVTKASHNNLPFPYSCLSRKVGIKLISMVWKYKNFFQIPESCIKIH